VKKLLYFFFLLGFIACKDSIQGDKLPNKKPETSLPTDTIIRFGGDRYNTNVFLQWNGDDADGVVVGYEFTFDSILNEATVWNYTTRTDSVFPMQIPLGNDSLNFVFSVRSIDNEGEKDPTPARFWVPIKNSAPSIRFVFKSNSGNPLAGGNPSFTISHLRYTWEATDDDGPTNIASVEFCLNDTNANPFPIDPKYSSATIRAFLNSGSIQNCEVIPGAAINPLPQKLNGLIPNDSNVLYIRATDKSGAKSAWVGSPKVKVAIPSGRLLVINSNNAPDAAAENFMKSQIQGQNIPFDFLPLFKKVNGQYQYLAADAKTQGQIFNLYDAIVWFGDDLEQSLAFAQATTADFVSKGGHLFLSAFTPSSSNIQSPSFAFSPIDSLIPTKAGFTQLLTDTSTLVPLSSGLPTLKYQQFLSGGRYMKLVGGATPWYHAHFLMRNNNNFSTSIISQTAPVMGMKTNPATGSKFVISTLEMNQLNGNSNIQSVFQKILKQEFGL
jgi:hypothetical protein